MMWRSLRAKDLATCLNLEPGHLGAELVGPDCAVDAWRHLIRSCSFQSAVIESDPAFAGRHVVAFGASVFVSRLFAGEEIRNPRPGLNARIIASLASGRSVVLNQDELRSANTEGGLDLVVLYGNWRRTGLDLESISEAQVLLACSFLQIYQGFRFNRILVEAINKLEIEYTGAAGIWKTVGDFRELGSRQPDTTWNKDRALFEVTAANAFSVPGSVMAMLFQYRAPVLRLPDSDQRLLMAALTGLTDQELVHSLNIPLSAVKKRWRSLFERASAHRDLFPELSGGFAESGRGRQKRQHVLAYVRDHPEELRPFQPGDRHRKRTPIRSQRGYDLA